MLSPPATRGRQHSEMKAPFLIHSIPTQPWKNQAGTTRHIASGQGWRVSVAEVGRDAPFSVFPNTQRHSVVIEGDGLELRNTDRPVDLLPHVVSSYEGGIEWQCHLLGNPATVLNIICENGVATADISVGREVKVCASSAEAIVVLPIRCSMSYVLGSGVVGVASCGTAFMSDGCDSLACRTIGDCKTGISYIIAVRLKTANHDDHS